MNTTRSIVLLFLVLALAACGTAANASPTAAPPPVAARASATPSSSTPTPAPSPTVAPTSTPSPTPTHFPTAWPTPVPIGTPYCCAWLRCQLSMVPVEAPNLGADKVVASPNGTFFAFIFMQPLGNGMYQDKLVVRKSDGAYYWLTSPCFLPWRPVTRLTWLSNQVLRFNIWSQPHWGWQYTVDVATGVLVATEPLHD